MSMNIHKFIERRKSERKGEKNFETVQIAEAKQKPSEKESVLADAEKLINEFKKTAE